MLSAIGNKTENLSRMEFLVRKAAQGGAQAICFPELNICGYSLRNEAAENAETIPGPSSEAVWQIAQKNEVLILAGLAEKKDGGIFISHFAAGPGGILGVYRKIHLGTPEEGIFQAGWECPVFRYGGTNFGIELCFDGHFPELSTILALKGAEIIFIPHASPRESGKGSGGDGFATLRPERMTTAFLLSPAIPREEPRTVSSFRGRLWLWIPKGKSRIQSRRGRGSGLRRSPEGFFPESSGKSAWVFSERRRPEYIPRATEKLGKREIAQPQR